MNTSGTMDQSLKPGTFQLMKQSGKARLGKLFTTHGVVDTPVFMPVGTRGAIRSMIWEDLESMGAKIILGNTYHLFLRPGDEQMKMLGGLHHFARWSRALLTDSGGFQVYSLAALRKITPEGVFFRSHLDGSAHFIGPKESMETQKILGSDIVMCFDECPALPATPTELRRAVDLSLKWAKVCREYPLQEHQALFGIVQGGLDLSLRWECLQQMNEMGFEGMALGGLSVGEKNQQMVDFLQDFAHRMPVHKARYLMGVGKPIDVLRAVHAGMDMFDCVLPTRNARNGGVLTHDGPLNIKNERFKQDRLPLDPHCQCRVCQRYDRAYLRYLHLVGEHSAGQLMTYHNLHFFLHFMEMIRASIAEDRFESFYAEYETRLMSDRWRKE